MPKITKICSICDNEYNTYNPSQQTCSKVCYGISVRGKNNPNFGNKWTDEQKAIQSDLIKSKVDDEYRQKAGSANRGKKFNQERIDAMHKHRSRESYSRPLSLEAKAKIGKKSKEKFNDPEYLIKQKSIMIERGFWIPDNQKTDYEIYQKEAHWIESMVDFLPKTDIVMLHEVGMFHSTKNKQGYVRDHMYSKMTGFAKKVFPILLRHPANLQLLLNGENTRKARTRIDDLSLEKLFENIQSFNMEWKEQNECLVMIDEYHRGNRWKRKEVKQNE